MHLFYCNLELVVALESSLCTLRLHSAHPVSTSTFTFTFPIDVSFLNIIVSSWRILLTTRCCAFELFIFAFNERSMGKMKVILTLTTGVGCRDPEIVYCEFIKLIIILMLCI